MQWNLTRGVWEDKCTQILLLSHKDISKFYKQDKLDMRWFCAPQRIFKELLIYPFDLSHIVKGEEKLVRSINYSPLTILALRYSLCTKLGSSSFFIPPQFIYNYCKSKFRMVSGRWIETGADLWKDRARSLQLRLRDRLRVAVDHHRRRPKIYDGYLSSSVERWLQRFRDFSRDTLPSSSAFYRKKGQFLTIMVHS